MNPLLHVEKGTSKNKSFSISLVYIVLLREQKVSLYAGKVCKVMLNKPILIDLDNRYTEQNSFAFFVPNSVRTLKFFFFEFISFFSGIPVNADKEL